MATAGGQEGLFSLEVLVEAVRVVAPGPARRPAVALRLLDFPTLLLRPAAAAGPPLRPDQAFPFGRGKRCLFRWRRDSLCAELRRRPLCALLLTLPAGLAPGPPCLLGSCDVSLAPVAAELLQQRPGAPASCGRRGRFPVRDAAGRPVGELVLGYRLSSLEAGGEPPLLNPASPRTAVPPAASLEPESEEEEEGEELEGNVFCPPMLYYSREAAEPHLPPAAAGRWEHVKAWRPQDKDKSPPRPSAGPSLLHPANPRQLHNTLGQLPLLSALLAELSVLAQSTVPAAVHPHLAWLYQAPKSGGMASQPPSPSRSSALKPAEAPVVPPGGSSRAASPQFKQGLQEATSPVSSWAGKGPKKAGPQGETGSERNCKTKENRPPRKKLLYGLTNTLRLRLQQTNPDKLIIHEKREQYRKKQMQMVKERSPLSRRKLLRNAGEQHVVSYRHHSKGNGSKQINRFDKAVESSLQNDAVAEHTSMTQDVSPDLQKRATASLLKNAAVESKEHPCKITTAPVLEENILKCDQKEKHAKAQLPEAFPTDANAEGSNEEAIRLIHHKTMEHDVSVVSVHKPSPNRNVENNSEFIYSDDFVSSPENTVYSEDFTSAECMGRDSEGLDSSPEPLQLESPKRGWSDTDVESSTSRISKTSQRAESTSDLLPVPSASSPVLSLKRIRDLKTSQRTSGESVDSLNVAQIDSSLLDEVQEAQRTNKEEDGSDQHIKQLPTLRSKQVCSDTDLNRGKGKTSAGKSQSVTQVTSYLPSNMSDLELSVLESSMSDNDLLGKLHVPNQYRDIGELVINKLPGYTM